MNGRVFAVNRSPVLAWNVEPQLQGPFADMPAAAAAAISPVVPAASDPYGRCWQNQVDTGTGYPYFGTLYSNSLPSPAYRLQPGCMTNLGQFWPPTPPPDGCGRFDGSNLYFAPPVTPVLRHGENVPQNLRNSFQGLGHYSHLVETQKESPSNQRSFKQETPASPSVSVPSMSMCSAVTKSDNISTYCVVDSKLKPLDSILSRSSKQDLHHSVSIGHESYSCVPDSRISSNSHPSTEKECFSPSYSLKNNLFHNSSQDVSSNKPKSQSLGLENNSNASPLKNVYFSHFESENVNPLPSKNFNKHYEGQYSYEHKNNAVEAVDNKHLKHSHQSIANNAYLAHSVYTSSKKYDFPSTQELCSVSPSYSTPRSERTADRLALMSEQCRQSNFYKVKPEKITNHSDCKFQKSSSKRSSSVIHVPDYRSLKDVFNIPTSHVHPKIEPNDKYFLPNCSATTQSCMTANTYINSGPLLTSDPRMSSGYHNMIFQNSCSLGKPWQLSGLPMMNHPDSYFKTPEAAKPPARGAATPNLALHEGIISVAQTAPQDMDVLRSSGKFYNHTSSSERLKRSHEEADDDVQVIGVQNKHNGSSSSKHNSRKNAESRSNSNMSQSIINNQLLRLKSENDQERHSAFSPSLNEQSRKTVLNMSNYLSPSPSTEQIGATSVKDIVGLSVQSKACDLSTSNIKHSIDVKEGDNFSVNDIKPQVTEAMVEKIESEHNAINHVEVDPFNNTISDCLPSVKSDPSLKHCAVIKMDPNQEMSSASENMNQNENASVISLIKLEEKSLQWETASVESKLVPENIVVAKEELVTCASPVCTFNENHGLNLLLDTIEKVASLKTLVKLEQKSIRSNILNNKPEIESKSNNATENASNSYSNEISLCGLESSKARGLDLLSAIAGQRFLTEFDSVKCEPEDNSHIKSNYPEVKKEFQEISQCSDAALKDSTDSNGNLSPSSVFEMRDRLMELQKKYKQKQKELSRLKPKKMLACSYLRERQRKLSSCESLQTAETINNLSTCSNLEMNISVTSSEDTVATTEELPFPESTSKSDGVSTKPIKNEVGKSIKEHKSLKRKLRGLRIKSNLNEVARRNSVSEETLVTCRPRTRRSMKAMSKSSTQGKSKSADECVEIIEPSKKSTKTLATSSSKDPLEQNGDCLEPPQISDVSSAKDALEADKTQSSEKNKNYMLRKSLHSIKRCKTEHPSDVIFNAAMTNSKTMTSKRKSDNPKKYMPSKQSKLSETIVAKHLRNRILFDTSGSVSDDDNQKDGGVPEELYDALMKCHLGEENKESAVEIYSQNNDKQESSDVQLGIPEASKLKQEHLVEKHRLLALEDGLMYAGCIKEIQSPDRYGVALDGQRGNRLHMFTREEMFTQTITESKPISSDLPEGTRVCAYWSQQYRCLYPGVVGKAPCPSADWSEPRVFVLFDDGDSGQIPIKNIRLIPSDIFPSEEEHNQQSETSSLESTDGSKSKCSNRGGKSRRLRSSRKHSRPKRREVRVQANECKESSCTSINDSSCDDSCFNDSSISPSQTLENPNCLESNSQCSPQTLKDNTDAKSEKRLRKHSKRKTSSRIKLKETDAEKMEKSKRHKRYKDKHKHHHHHHHHHRHHHHHHHHSKKRKHRRRNGSTSKNLSFSQDSDIQETIPSCSVSKRRKNQAENGLDHVGHSTAVDLPQSE